jgi:hypothetical protein
MDGDVVTVGNEPVVDTGWVIVILTAALVVVTGYYAWQNRQMVAEMRESRRMSVAPKLGVSIFMLGPTYGVARLVNIGHGPAINVDVTLRFQRRDASGVVERAWQATFMPPGETHDFIEPDDLGDVQSMEALARICSSITVRGTMRSSLGDVIEVSETTGDLQEWFEMSKAAHHLWDEEPRRKIPKELERIRKELEKINRARRAGAGSEP